MKFITYNIENIEPIKQTATLMQSDNEYSKSYISGANIRGAFIANYIKQKGIQNINEGTHKEKLLEGGIKFLNAYPSVDNTRTLPFPRCFFSEKDNIKKFSITNNLELLRRNELDDKNKYYDKVKSFEFAKWNIKDEELIRASVDKIGNLHIRKGKKDDNKLFRYEAIKANQQFKGIILCENDEDVKEVEEILKNGIFYLGGSKGTGYGLCKITKIRIEDVNPEIRINAACLLDNDSEELILVATSDIIYRDELGEYKSVISEEFIKDSLNLEEVKLKETYIDTDYITGFNNKWGYRLPNILGIKAGSVLVYKIKGELDKELVVNFINKGIGERRAEGFGRIILLSEIPFSSVSFDKEYNNGSKNVKLNNEESKQLKLIVDRIYRQKLKNTLPKIVLNLSQELKGITNIKKNQWGKLFNMMFLLEGISPAEGIDKLKKYFDNINSKKTNTDLKHAFERIKIKDDVLQKYMEDELKDLNEDRFNSYYVNRLKISNVESKISEEEIYKYKVQVFKELFRFQLRECEKKGDE